MSLATDFIAGFQTTAGLARDRKNDKLAEARLIEDAKLAQARLRIEEDAVIARSDSARADRSARRQNEIEANKRFIAAQTAADSERAARADDPREQLARAKASIDLEQMRNPPPLSPDEQMKQDIARMKIEKEFAALSSPPAPTARVRQPFGPGGKGMAEFDAPLDQLPSITGASKTAAYKSPHARRIGELDQVIA